MTGRIIRLVVLMTMAFYITGKVMAFAPILAIPLIGASVAFCINEVRGIKDDKAKSKKKKTVKKKTTKK